MCVCVCVVRISLNSGLLTTDRRTCNNNIERAGYQDNVVFVDVAVVYKTSVITITQMQGYLDTCKSDTRNT